MKIAKIFRKKRAVSPILAAILLIGLAVAAGAVMFVVILPMIAGPGLQISIDQTNFAFTDTDSNKIYEKVKVPIKNTGGVDVSVTAIKVQTSSDGGTTWNDAARTSGLTVPIDIVSGAGVVPEFTFVPNHNDFLTSGEVQYRVVVNYKAEGDDTTSTLESTAETKEQDGFGAAQVNVDAGYYHQYTLGTATITYSPRDANTTAETDQANVIAVTVTNNWDCDIVLDKNYGSYGGGWVNGLYASTDDSYTSTGVDEIYGLCVPGDSFGEAFACTAGMTSDQWDYSDRQTQNTFWIDTLGQSGTIYGTDSPAGRTITPGETQVLHFFALGQGYVCVDDTLYYFGVSFYDTEFRWSETISVTSGSYS